MCRDKIGKWESQKNTYIRRKEGTKYEYTSNLMTKCIVNVCVVAGR